MTFVAKVAAMVATVAALCESGMTVQLYSDSSCTTQTDTRYITESDIAYFYDHCIDAGSYHYITTCENDAKIKTEFANAGCTGSATATEVQPWNTCTLANDGVYKIYTHPTYPQVLDTQEDKAKIMTTASIVTIAAIVGNLL